MTALTGQITARDVASAGFEAMCPHVLQNPYIPHLPHPKQAVFLGAHLKHRDSLEPFECLYGGAAGGGKSDALLMAVAQYAWKYPHFRAVLIRRTHAEMAKAGAIMDRGVKWWLSIGAKWNGADKILTFPSGATVEFGYHEQSTDDAKYQGGEWHLVGFDELTHWKDPSAFEWLKSRLRKQENDPIPLRLLATTNPGGPGHVWVKQRFVTGSSMYIKATVHDNPSLNIDEYVATLSSMHPTRREQLLAGNWDARDPGDYFRAEWFGQPLDEPIPKEWKRSIRWWDLAASEKPDAAFTSGVLMSRLVSGVRIVEHCRSFRRTPGARDDLIVQQARLDGKSVTVGIEIEGGSGGLAQFESLERRLRREGFQVVGARPRAELSDRDAKAMLRNPIGERGKMARAEPVASCLERGWQRRACDGLGEDTGASWWAADAGKPILDQKDGIRIVGGEWTQNYLDVLEGFPDAATCDEVDATSGAWAWLEAHPAGLSVAPQPKKSIETPSEIEHPDVRRRHAAMAGRDYAGRWKP